MTTYFVVEYDNEASGPFTAEGANLTWNAATESAFIITVIDRGTTGKLYCAAITGGFPVDNETLTQGATTADADGDGVQIAYPAYFREDVSLVDTAGDIVIDWTGPALGATHSFFFDGQTGNVTAGDTLTFSPDGQTAEVITVESDAGATGELSVRFISDLDAGLPGDNDTFSNGASGDGTVNGVVHPRAYSPLELHRMLQDLNDDEDISGNDDLSRINATPSERSTDQIIELTGSVTMTDTVAQHMYGGSVDQTETNGLTRFSGLDVQVTSPTESTRPVLIQNDGIITDYWNNAYMPDSIAGNVRILVKTIEDGVAIDGGRIRGALLEFGDSYFFGGTTLGQATTALALFASTDGNNQTAVGTVAGAPYNSVTQTEGLQLIDYNNGNGNTEFGYELGYGTASSPQAYERSKYIQRRGTAETLFGRNAQLFIGFNMNFPYDNESANLTQSEIMYWGTEVAFSGQTTNFSAGEVITFSGGGRGRLLYADDGGATGTVILAGATGTLTGTMTGLTSGGNGTAGAVVNNATSGSFLAMAIDDDGTTGNLYGQLLSGIIPADNQTLFGGTSGNTVDVNGTVSTRTINNQYIGTYTGTNFQTNFGIAIDPANAILGDLNRNLADVQQGVPDNQQGRVTGLKAGDTVTCYPWDGSTVDANGDAVPDFDEMTLDVALTSGSTSVDVNAIPENTPSAGFLRVERDSDGNYELLEYSSFTGSVFTLVGTAGIAAGIGNNVIRALLDEELTADGDAFYTAIKGVGTTQTTVTVKNGYTAAKNGPIKVFKSNPTFGSTGFEVGAVRTSDA